MILTEEMQKIMNLIQDDENNVFVTGKAGSGKTTFLKYLIEKSGKNCIVAAPTGIAAINAGGVTLHSLFGIPFGPITPYDQTGKQIFRIQGRTIAQNGIADY